MKRSRKLASAALVALLSFAPMIPGQPRQDSNAARDLAARARAVLSPIKGRLRVAGLSRPVEVLRDPWGVAHIYAESTDDLFFAQGFVAAQDRLWQLELWRRAAEGEMAEILGPDAIERDRIARLLRYRGDMEAEWKSYAPDTKAIVEAFVRGINASIEASRSRLPIEFQLTGIEPKPWRPETVLSRVSGLEVTLNLTNEVARAQLVRMIGREKVERMLETDPPARLEIPEGLDLSGIDMKILYPILTAGAPPAFQGMTGSNNWVVNGSRTATGKPLLANDPHRRIAIPSLRYLVHLVAPGWNVIGAGEPALPGVSIGHNERIAFGLTVVGIDQADLYVEETHPENPTLYRVGDKWQAMRIESESLRVKGRMEPVEIDLKFTRHGPVIYEDRERRRAYALCTIATEPGTASYLASLSLCRARNWQEFLAATARWHSPSQNLIYADVDGNIGWQATGLAPRRRGWNGLLPVPGASGRYEWDGFLPPDQLPRIYNPAKGYIATANHNILPQGYQHALSHEWAAPFRFQRVEEMLEEKRRFTVRDFERMQHDELSLPARQLVPLIGEVSGAEAREAAALLKAWDFVLSRDSAAAAIFQVWLSTLKEAVFRPGVPDEAWPLLAAYISMPVLIREVRGLDEAARRKAFEVSLRQAVEELRHRLGPEARRWRWGDLHLTEFRHALSSDAAQRAIFDLPPARRGGDGNTVNAAAGAGYKATHGASFRQVIDVGDWDRSTAINVPGQSGQPGSPHYGDLLPLWAEGRYFPLLYSRARVEREAKRRLVLEPLATENR